MELKYWMNRTTGAVRRYSHPHGPGVEGWVEVEVYEKPEPEVAVKYFNLYRENDGSLHVGGDWDSRDKVDKVANPDTPEGRQRVGRKRVEFTEGTWDE